MTHHHDPLRPRTFRRDVWSWITALALLASAVAGIYLYQHHTVVRDAVAAQALSADPRIVVLSYDRVVGAADGKNVHADRLWEHIGALRDNGFEPVSLRALADFYAHGNPLPAKSLVLLFEYGYLDTYRFVDPLLERAGWNATVSLITRRQAMKDTSFLYWDRLQRMVNSGRWDIAVQGERAMDQIDVDAKSGTAPFINQRAWIHAAQRIETGEEFGDRIAADVRSARQSIEQGVPGYAVQAYSYPYDSIAQRSADPEVETGFERMLEGCCTLAFSDDPFGVNGAADDPRHLRRLRVKSAWSGEELLQRVDAALRNPAGIREARDAPVWIDASGNIVGTDTNIVLDTASGNQAWLAGSRWTESWTLRARVQSVAGQFWLTQSNQARGDGWRIGGEGSQLRVQSLEQGRPARTLAQFDVADMAVAAHQLVVTRRGAGIWIDWNGQRLTDLPIFVGVASGHAIGWTRWSDSGAGRLIVQDVQLVEHPGRVVTLSAQPDVDEVQELARRAIDVAAIAIPVGGSAVGDNDLLRVLAHRYALEIVPMLEARAHLTPDESAAALLRLDLPPATRHVAIALDGLDAKQRQQFEQTTLPELRAALRRRGLTLLVPAAPLLKAVREPPMPPAAVVNATS